MNIAGTIQIVFAIPVEQWKENTQFASCLFFDLD